MTDLCAVGRALTRVINTYQPDPGIDFVNPCPIPPTRVLILGDGSRWLPLCADHFRVICAELDKAEQ